MRPEIYFRETHINKSPPENEAVTHFPTIRRGLQIEEIGTVES